MWQSSGYFESFQNHEIGSKFAFFPQNTYINVTCCDEWKLIIDKKN